MLISEHNHLFLLRHQPIMVFDASDGFDVFEFGDFGAEAVQVVHVVDVDGDGAFEDTVF